LLLFCRALQLKQAELSMYFANITNVITVSKPIIATLGGGATDLAFIIMGIVVGAAGLFGILILTFYWRQ